MMTQLSMAGRCKFAPLAGRLEGRLRSFASGISAAAFAADRVWIGVHDAIDQLLQSWAITLNPGQGGETVGRDLST